MDPTPHYSLSQGHRGRPYEGGSYQYFPLHHHLVLKVDVERLSKDDDDLKVDVGLARGRNMDLAGSHAGRLSDYDAPIKTPKRLGFFNLGG